MAIETGRLVLLAGGLLLACVVAPSETIYSNFSAQGPDGTGGGYSLGGPFQSLPGSGFNGVAVAFVPTKNYAVDSIRIPINAFRGAANIQITVELREGATEPGNVLESYSSYLSGFVVVDFKSNLHPALQAVKQYWVSVIVTSGNGEWGWGGVVHPAGTVFVRNTQNSGWSAMSPPSNIPGLYVSGTALPNAVPPIIEIIDTRVPASTSSIVGVAVYGKPQSYSPTGTVTLKEGNNVLATSSTASGGIYVMSVPLTAAGSHQLTAYYSGDALYLPGQSSPRTVQAIATTVSLTSSELQGPVFGVRATVVGAARCIGTLTLVEGGKTLATKVLDVPSGTAEFLSTSYPQLTDGYHTITAIFGATSYGCGPGTSAPFRVYIGVPTTVTEIVSVSPNPSRFGDLPQMTVRVTASAGVASGRVTLKQGISGFGSGDLDATGLASVKLPSLPVGSWSVTAEYGGSAMAKSSLSAPVTVVVNPAVIFVSAAGSQKTLAPDCIASAYGLDLASTTALATTRPLPTELVGVQVWLAAKDGSAQKAQLLYVSPQQVNFVVPSQAKTGNVGIEVSRGQQRLVGEAAIETVAPAIFTADGSESGVPVAALVTVRSDGLQESRLVYDCRDGLCRAVELELAADGTNVLVLYATGIRNAQLGDVTARADSIELPVQYAGAQDEEAGLDQVNLLIPATLAGRGTVRLEITVAGKSGNPVTLRFR